MRTRESIVERVTVADVLRLAGLPAPTARGVMRCPSHDDEHPSARVQPSGRGWRCHACGAHGGVLDLVVALGRAHDRRHAAKWIEVNLP